MQISEPADAASHAQLRGGPLEFLRDCAGAYCVETLFRLYSLLPEAAGRQYRRFVVSDLAHATSTSVNKAFAKASDASTFANAVQQLSLRRNGGTFHLLRAYQPGRFVASGTSSRRCEPTSR